MRHIRTLAVLVAACALAAPAVQAAPPNGVRMEDAADDANFVNDQYLCRTAPCTDESLENGVSVRNVNAAADIRSVTITTTYATKRTKDRRGRVVTTKAVDGFQVAVELAGPPVDGVTYNLRAANAACPNYAVTYRRYPSGNRATLISGDCLGFPGYVDLQAARETANGFVLTVPLRHARLPVGGRLEDLRMFTRVVAGTPVGTFQPLQYDYVETDEVFRLGP